VSVVIASSSIWRNFTSGQGGVLWWGRGQIIRFLVRKEGMMAVPQLLVFTEGAYSASLHMTIELLSINSVGSCAPFRVLAHLEPLG
jgi:hypothetical protein